MHASKNSREKEEFDLVYFIYAKDLNHISAILYIPQMKKKIRKIKQFAIDISDFVGL